MLLQPINPLDLIGALSNQRSKVCIKWFLWKWPKPEFKIQIRPSNDGDRSNGARTQRASTFELIRINGTKKEKKNKKKRGRNERKKEMDPQTNSNWTASNGTNTKTMNQLNAVTEKSAPSSRLSATGNQLQRGGEWGGGGGGSLHNKKRPLISLQSTAGFKGWLQPITKNKCWPRIALILVTYKSVRAAMGHQLSSDWLQRPHRTICWHFHTVRLWGLFG